MPFIASYLILNTLNPTKYQLLGPRSSLSVLYSNFSFLCSIHGTCVYDIFQVRLKTKKIKIQLEPELKRMTHETKSIFSLRLFF